MQVPVVDLADWLLQNNEKAEILILRLDIEGAEYSFLERTLELRVWEKLRARGVRTHVFVEWRALEGQDPDYRWTLQNDLVESGVTTVRDAEYGFMGYMAEDRNQKNAGLRKGNHSTAGEGIVQAGGV